MAGKAAAKGRPANKYTLFNPFEFKIKYIGDKSFYLELAFFEQFFFVSCILFLLALCCIVAYFLSVLNANHPFPFAKLCRIFFFARVDGVSIENSAREKKRKFRRKWGKLFGSFDNFVNCFIFGIINGFLFVFRHVRIN